jgi:hypothetical protein
VIWVRAFSLTMKLADGKQDGTCPNWSQKLYIKLWFSHTFSCILILQLFYWSFLQCLHQLKQLNNHFLQWTVLKRMLAVQGRMIVFLLLLLSIEIEIDRQEIISIFGPRRQENSIFIFKDSRLNTSIVFYYFRDDCSGITYIIIEMSVCLSDYI